MSVYAFTKWRLVQHSITCLCHRNMTTTEVSTALRPFYFSVHPDLFGQYPQQRTTNENSLKLLSSYIENIQNTIGVSKIIWDCGWNEMHFRGCLQSFIALAEQNPEPMHILKGRVLVFAPFTGVSLDGHIMLYTGEVRHNWLDLIKKVRKYDEVLLRIPGFEKTVSQVLRDIKVVRRKFMPKILAGEYERQLQQLTTSLSDYHGLRGYPKHWPKSLSNYEIVVETEAGPLMVSPTGQFIVPSSCPGSLLVNFLSENMEEAAIRLKTYTTNKYVERSLREECMKQFHLESLHKDDNVTPDLMIECCKRMIQNKDKLHDLNNLQLNISTYYSVLSDGVVCIPWNFEL
ncbi:hypothetical protein Trydic_g10429 [Trypoxylus dichotomus]